MSVAVGQLIAYAKISVLAFAIMGGVWLLVRIIEKGGRKKGDD